MAEQRHASNAPAFLHQRHSKWSRLLVPVASDLCFPPFCRIFAKLWSFRSPGQQPFQADWSRTLWGTSSKNASYSLGLGRRGMFSWSSGAYHQPFHMPSSTSETKTATWMENICLCCCFRPKIHGWYSTRWCCFHYCSLQHIWPIATGLHPITLLMEVSSHKRNWFTVGLSRTPFVLGARKKIQPCTGTGIARKQQSTEHNCLNNCWPILTLCPNAPNNMVGLQHLITWKITLTCWVALPGRSQQFHEVQVQFPVAHLFTDGSACNPTDRIFRVATLGVVFAALPDDNFQHLAPKALFRGFCKLYWEQNSGRQSPLCSGFYFLKFQVSFRLTTNRCMSIWRHFGWGTCQLPRPTMIMICGNMHMT